MRRWAKPKENGCAGQLALAFDGRTDRVGQIAERPRIETERAALGPIDTSREAAESVQEHAAASRRLVLSLIRGAGVRGCTCDEVSAATGRDPNQLSGRFTELDRLGLIQQSGARRPTRTGRAAHVWICVRRQGGLTDVSADSQGRGTCVDRQG